MTNSMGAIVDKSFLESPVAREELISGVHEVPEGDADAELVAGLRTLGDTSTLPAAAAAGRLIAAYREESYAHEAPRIGFASHCSFRRLSRLPGMPLSSASLCRAVTIYELSQQMPELLSFRRVGIGHVSIVSKLPQDLQVHLLSLAESHGWSRSSLQIAVDEAQRPPQVEPPVTAAVPFAFE